MRTAAQSSPWVARASAASIVLIATTAHAGVPMSGTPAPPAPEGSRGAAAGSGHKTARYPVIFRDFEGNDFERGITIFDKECGEHIPTYSFTTEMVQPKLGENGKPLWKGVSGKGGITTEEQFAVLWNSDPTFNRQMVGVVEFVETPDGGLLHDHLEFYPLDSRATYSDLDAVETNTSSHGEHNQLFTLEFHTSFKYRGGEKLRFLSDDDLYVFINGSLAVNIGGCHPPTEAAVNLDDLQLTEGNTYPLDLFFADRACCGSALFVETNFMFAEPIPLAEEAILFELVTKPEAGGQITVTGANMDTAVTIPASAFDAVQNSEIYVAVSSVDETAMNVTHSIAGAVDVSLYSTASWEKLVVEGLVEPIVVTLPTLYQDGIRCAYFNEDADSWTFDGVSTQQSAEGLVVCITSHLTIFGALLLSIKDTIICSQVSLMTWDAIRMLGEGGWYLDSAPVLVWGFYVLVLSVFILALALDMSRAPTWADEDFLLPSLKEPEGQAHHDGCGREAMNDNFEQTQPWCRRQACATGKAKLRSVISCREAVIAWIRNLRAFLSRAVHFSENQPLSCTACCCHSTASSAKMPEEMHEEGRRHGLLRAVMSWCLRSSALQYASAELWLSPIDLWHISQDDVASELLFAEVDGQRTKKKSSRMCGIYRLNQAGVKHCGGGSVGGCSFPSHEVAPPLEELRHLHRLVLYFSHEGLQKSTSWGALCSLVARHLKVGNPISAVCMPSIFISASMRTLFLACHTFGNLLVLTLLFQSTHTVHSRFSDSSCADVRTVSSWLGRLICVATASELVSDLPIWLLYIMHSRRFKHVEEAGRSQQLRIWHSQDALIWLLGCTYLAACNTIILIFVANVSRRDQGEWLVFAAFTLVQQFVVIPVVAAFCLASVAILLLRHVSWFAQTGKDAEVARVHKCVVAHCQSIYGDTKLGVRGRAPPPKDCDTKIRPPRPGPGPKCETSDRPVPPHDGTPSHGGRVRV